MYKERPTLTIFTATYNRRHLLPRLYQSLCRQRSFDFEWLIIDDGSSDNTADLVNGWASEDLPFQIRFYWQENQGLIRTLNRGVMLAKGEYFSKIDSDDYVVDSYAEDMLMWLEEIRDETDIYGAAGIKIKLDGTPIKGRWPKIETGCYVDATDLERKQYDLDADMSEAWRTEVLRKHPFPVWPGEKFAPEQIVFHEIAREGLRIRWRPIPMCICEYQEEGLTLGARRLERENPMGYAMMYNYKLKYLPSFRERAYAAMQMTALSLVGGHPTYILSTYDKLCTALTAIPAVFLSFRRWRQFKDDEHIGK